MGLSPKYQYILEDIKLEPTGIKEYNTGQEREARGKLLELLKNCPIPDDQVVSNLGLFLNSKTLSRILLMAHLYEQIIDVQGVVLELGTRWGQNIALFSALRGIFDPFNRHRKIVGFDTFKGFPSVDDKDGKSYLAQKGTFACTENYDKYLYHQPVPFSLIYESLQ